MNYILNNKYNIKVDGKEINTSLNTYLNLLLMKNLRTISSIYKSAKKLNISRYLIPIYIDSETLLVPIGSIKSEDAFLFNFFNILDIKIHDYESIFIFKDGTSIRINSSKYRVHKSIKRSKNFITFIHESI